MSALPSHKSKGVGEGCDTDTGVVVQRVEMPFLDNT